MNRPLTNLTPGMALVYGGDRVVEVDEALADAFEAGDRLVVVQGTGDLLHIGRDQWALASRAIDSAIAAFEAMSSVGEDQVSDFFARFAARLGDDEVFGSIADANEADVRSARKRGRSVTRLELSAGMRAGMIDALETWARLDGGRGRVEEEIAHPGWTLQQVRSGLGVVGFVFEGRPNVFADATGVLVTGNTVVFRIGSDALGTARAIMRGAVVPALEASGLPQGAVTLIDSASRAAGWAMFSDSRLGLAVARGSGPAVAQLGAVARQSGIPVSLHGTGGAWLVASDSAKPESLAAAVFNSLDRKVCNTLNTVCVVESRAAELIPVVLDAIHRAGSRAGGTSKLHFTRAARSYVPDEWLAPAEITRAEGPVVENRAELIGDDELGVEWEWENSPEVTLTVTADVDEATRLFNDQSARLVVCLVSDDAGEMEHFFLAVDAPFVGNGFTRWVDGQFALDRPELGLSNWENGRLLGRSGVLSGDSIYTIRTRVTQTDPDLAR